VLHGSLIRSLNEDTQGNLWVGSLGSGAVRIAPDGQAKQYSTKTGLPSNTIFCLAPAKDGSVWGCTEKGLARIYQERVRVFTEADGLLSRRVRSTCQAADGTRWVAALDYGLSHSDNSGSRFVTFSDKLLPRGRSVTALECSSDGSVWAGTPEGLVHIAGSASRIFTTRDGLPDNEVSALTQDKNGTLWIGTNDGISRLLNGEISVYRTRDGLSHSQVLALRLDREGTLWAGTKNGLDQFTDGKVTPYTTNEGLSSNNVGPLLEDRAGHLWIGTLGHGLNFFDGHRFRNLTMRNGLSSDTILSLALDASGDLWAGTAKGLDRLRNGTVIESFGPAQGLRGSAVRSLFVDLQGTVWVGTETALQYLRDKRLVEGLLQPRPARSSAVIALSGSHSVPLFASLDGAGLYQLHRGELSVVALPTTHAIHCFFIDHLHRTIWMGTLGSGLLRWKNNTIVHVYVKDGLYDNRIYSILQDANSNFWLASSKGIFRVSRDELDRFADGKLKSLTSIPFSTGQLRFECKSGVQPAACRTTDGRLWFSTTSGLVVVDPNHLQANRVAPPVSIAAMLINGTRLPLYQEAHLKPRETNNVEIRYAGLSFISPEKVRFRYRLVGYDKTWLDAGTRREAFYTNLPPGNFEFRVQARNADGVWSTEPAALRFVVEPRLYQRRWFFPLVLLLLALAIAAGWRMRLRQLRSRFNHVLTERNRIARELHDTLLQGLAGVTMQLQALWTRMPPSPEKRALADIISDAGQCSAEARRSLWGLRNNSTGGLEFANKLVNLARQAVSDKNMSLSLRVEPVSLRDYPDTEYQLLRIAGEAITNTLKHSRATQLSLNLQVTDGALVLAIEDDGVGFSTFAQPADQHFGLQGMRERAAEIGAEISVASSPGNGTRIAVSLRLPGDFRPAGNDETVAAHQLQ
jgi:signal transduction histidine kinase/ligand-binding sensor domain-containing protein